MTADLHPWNTGFQWRMPSAAPTMLTADQFAQFDTDGFVVLQDVFDAATLAPVIAEIDEFEAETERRLRQLEGGRFAIAEAGAITFTTHLVTRSPTIHAFAQRDEFVSLCHDLIGADVRLYWDQAVYKKPEKPRRFPWHQDNGYAFVEPQQYVTCWVALTDATVDNGCPQVARGWHRYGTLRHRYVEPLGWECFGDPVDVAVAEVRAGGVVVFSSLTPHLTGPNTSEATRKAYIVQFAPDGAVRLDGNPNDGPPTTRTIQDDPARQFLLRERQPGG